MDATMAVTLSTTIFTAVLLYQSNSWQKGFFEKPGTIKLEKMLNIRALFMYLFETKDFPQFIVFLTCVLSFDLM